jgi:thioredoxin reductase (NADPH)
VIDVDEDPVLQSRYGERVPVLVADGKEVCHYHLDPVAFEDLFPSRS